MKICEEESNKLPKLISGHLYKPSDTVYNGPYIYCEPSNVLVSLYSGNIWAKYCFGESPVKNGTVWEDVTDKYCLQKIGE